MRTSSLALRLTPLAMLGVVALAVPALAQSSSGGPAALTVYPACTGQPSKDDSEVAHGAYIAGKRAFDENDYPTAIQYFKDAFRRDCTKYELLNIISRSYELKGDRLEAINALETYLKHAPANDPGNEAIQKRLTNLRTQAAAEASAKAGATTSASATPTTTSAAASGSAAPTATSTSTSAPPETREHTVGPWILVGVGGAALVTGVVLFAIGEGDISSASDLCSPDIRGKCTIAGGDVAATNKQNQGNTEAAIGGIVGGVGVLAVAGGLVWHFLEPVGPAPSSTTGRLQVHPDAHPGYAGLSIGGSF